MHTERNACLADRRGGGRGGGEATREIKHSQSLRRCWEASTPCCDKVVVINAIKMDIRKGAGGGGGRYLADMNNDDDEIYIERTANIKALLKLLNFL